MQYTVQQYDVILVCKKIVVLIANELNFHKSSIMEFASFTISHQQCLSRELSNLHKGGNSYNDIHEFTSTSINS